MSLNKKTPIKKKSSLTHLLTLIVIACIGVVGGFSFKHFSKDTFSNGKGAEINGSKPPSLKIPETKLNNDTKLSKAKITKPLAKNKLKKSSEKKSPLIVLKKINRELKPREISNKSNNSFKRTQPLQKANPDTIPNWKKYAVQVELTGDSQIVVIFDDMGVDQIHSKIVTDLLAPLTLSYLPYSRNIKEQTQRAANNGHELLMHIPMEPINHKIDPGPNVLLDGIPEDELLHTLRWNLNQFTKFVGVNNHMGSNFTSNYSLMKIVFRELKQRGLFILDSLTSNNSKGEIVAKSLNLPFVKRDLFIDHVDDKIAIKKQLLQVEKISQARGFAIAICHPRETTINIIRPWLLTLKKKGFQLIPLSAVIASKFLSKNK